MVLVGGCAWPKLSVFEALGLLPGEEHPVNHGEIPENGDHPQYRSHTVGQRADDEQYNSLGLSIKPTLQVGMVFSARERV